MTGFVIPAANERTPLVVTPSFKPRNDSSTRPLSLSPRMLRANALLQSGRSVSTTSDRPPMPEPGCSAGTSGGTNVVADGPHQRQVGRVRPQGLGRPRIRSPLGFRPFLPHAHRDPLRRLLR